MFLPSPQSVFLRVRNPIICARVAQKGLSRRLSSSSVASSDKSRSTILRIPTANVYRFGDGGKATPVFKELDWTINEGESWAIVGPAGNEKSLLLEVKSMVLLRKKTFTNSFILLTVLTYRCSWATCACRPHLRMDYTPFCQAPTLRKIPINLSPSSLLQLSGEVQEGLFTTTRRATVPLETKTDSRYAKHFSLTTRVIQPLHSSICSRKDST